MSTAAPRGFEVDVNESQSRTQYNIRWKESVMKPTVMATQVQTMYLMLMPALMVLTSLTKEIVLELVFALVGILTLISAQKLTLTL